MSIQFITYELIAMVHIKPNTRLTAIDNLENWKKNYINMYPSKSALLWNIATLKHNTV